MAKLLTKVAVQREVNAVTVVLHGNGPLAYRIVPVGARRLSLDLPLVKSGIQFRELPIEHRLLERIRIGQHPKKLRVVFDLNPQLSSHVRYAVKAKGNRVFLRLTMRPGRP